MKPTTIVVPCYNEASRLDPGAFEDFLRRRNAISFLFVDDGSTDRTADVLRRLGENSNGRCRYLSLPENRGKAEAVRSGMLEAFESGARYVGFWDADLATPLETIPTFCRILDDNPDLSLVIGARVQLLGRRIDRSPARHYVGRFFATVVSLMLGMPVYDTQCGAKLFRASPNTRALFLRPFSSRWVFDVEILARMIRMHRETGGAHPGDAVYEVPLTEWRDVRGSKLRLGDFLRAVPELGRIYWNVLRPVPSSGSAPRDVDETLVKAGSGPPGVTEQRPETTKT